MKEKVLFQIIIWNANFPPIVMVWKTAECCGTSNSWLFRWFFSRSFSILLRGSFNKFGEWKVSRCLPCSFVLFFTMWQKNLPHKTVFVSPEFCQLISSLKAMFVHLLRELEKAKVFVPTFQIQLRRIRGLPLP